MSDTRAKTIICDIDGTLLKHAKLTDITSPAHRSVVLDGVLDKLYEWDSLGYNLILITGRRKSMRVETENELVQLGVIYDELIMGVGGGKRILINDLKPNSDDPYAIAVNVKRDVGIGDITI